MNKKILLIIVLVGVVIGTVIFIKSDTTVNMDEVTNDTMMQEMFDSETMLDGSDDAMMHGESDDAMMQEGMQEGHSMMDHGTYESYEPSKIASASTGDVVLFFHASWCPTCREIDGDIKKNLSNIPPNLTILDIDYDNSSALKKKYGVTYQHTFVQVDADGNLLKKWSSSPTLKSLVAEVI